MITDNETNYLYLSSLLTKQRKYLKFWHRFKAVLEQGDIPYSFIEGTRDIWCRDYMPIQIRDNHFVQFRFFPDYYIDPNEIHKLTIPNEVQIDRRLNCHYSELVVDGGNIVKSGNRAILTDKVFTENHQLSKEKVLTILKTELDVENLVVIPNQPLDFTGHSDGMVKFLNETELLVSDYSNESKSWKRKMDKALEKSGLEIHIFPSVVCDEKNNVGDYTAKGCYINFVSVGNKILLPQFDFEQDELALKTTQRYFPNHKVIPVLSNEIALDGGVLNCITWNIRQ